MKIIAIVNGGFSVPSLRALKNSRHELVATIVMPIHTKYFGRKVCMSPGREMAQSFMPEIPMFAPEDINSIEGITLLKSFNADLIFICDYGKILSKEVLLTTKYGGINLHGSLLPKYRGAAPINRAIQAGEREIGVSVIFIEPKVDAGPIVAKASYHPKLTETAIEIELNLAQMGAPLVIEAIDNIDANTIEFMPQNTLDSSKAPKIRKEEGRIDWSRACDTIIDLFRAFQPWPRTYSYWASQQNIDGTPLRVILGPFSKLSKQSEKNFCDFEILSRVEVGTVVYVSKEGFGIKAGDGVLNVLSIQPSGKKCMSSSAFLQGYRLQVGDRFY